MSTLPCTASCQHFQRHHPPRPSLSTASVFVRVFTNEPLLQLGSKSLRLSGLSTTCPNNSCIFCALARASGTQSAYRVPLFARDLWSFSMRVFLFEAGPLVPLQFRCRSSDRRTRALADPRHDAGHGGSTTRNRCHDRLERIVVHGRG